MPAVDLSTGTQGAITFRSGERFWCPLIELHGDTYAVRYEHGWYAEYRCDGTLVCAGVIVHKDGSKTTVAPAHRDIVAFEPCDYRDDLPGEVTP